MKMFFALALLASIGAVHAEDTKFSPLEKQAWLEQCTTVYSGDDASCASLLDKQVSKLGKGQFGQPGKHVARCHRRSNQQK